MRFPARVQHFQGRRVSDPSTDGGVGLEIAIIGRDGGQSGHSGQSRLLELGDDIVSSPGRTDPAGGPSLQLRLGKIGNVVPGPFHVELIGQLFELGFDAGVLQESASAQEEHCNCQKEAEHRQATGVEPPPLDEPLQAIAEKVEAQDGDEECQCGCQGKPGVRAEPTPGGTQHRPPVGHIEIVVHFHLRQVEHGAPAADEELDEA